MRYVCLGALCSRDITQRASEGRMDTSPHPLSKTKTSQGKGQKRPTQQNHERKAQRQSKPQKPPRANKGRQRQNSSSQKGRPPPTATPPQRPKRTNTNRKHERATTASHDHKGQQGGRQARAGTGPVESRVQASPGKARAGPGKSRLTPEAHPPNPSPRAGVQQGERTAGRER